MEKIKIYRRIYRICPRRNKEILKDIPKKLLCSIPENPREKKCLTLDEVKILLKGHVSIEEKIDGGILGISWNGINPLTVGKHSMINFDINTKKFCGLSRWIYENYEKISKIPKGYIIYGEWMKAKHNIFYNNLPDFFIGFDVWNGKRFFNNTERSIFLYDMRFEEVSTIYTGNNLSVTDLIYISEGIGGVSNKSRFNDKETIEGIIIRNDNGIIGKYVRKEFSDSIEENWINLPFVKNKLIKRK